MAPQKTTPQKPAIGIHAHFMMGSFL